MKRCVVTGAAGLIGSHLVPALAPAWEVHAVSRHCPVGKEDLNVVWHQMDLSQEFDRRELPDHADAIVHLAQSEHFREFPQRALEIFQVNTVSLLQLLDYARSSGVRHFIYASSGGVYGTGDATLNEDVPVLAEGNLGFYLGTKLCSEIVARNYAALMNVVILRFFFVYGPRQRTTMLIPRLIESVRVGAPVILHGDDGVRLNPVYVSDAAESVVRGLGLEGSYKINVAGPEILSLREICEKIGRAVGRAPIYHSEKGEPRHIIGDIAKMSDLLATPRVGFNQGLQFMLEAGRTVP
jgi:UDP-glucose 4-epimerase